MWKSCFFVCLFFVVVFCFWFFFFLGGGGWFVLFFWFCCWVFFVCVFYLFFFSVVIVVVVLYFHVPYFLVMPSLWSTFCKADLCFLSISTMTSFVLLCLCLELLQEIMIRFPLRKLLCFRQLSEGRFMLGALHRRNQYTNFCHDLMQNHLW